MCCNCLNVYATLSQYIKSLQSCSRSTSVASSGKCKVSFRNTYFAQTAFSVKRAKSWNMRLQTLSVFYFAKIHRHSQHKSEIHFWTLTSKKFLGYFWPAEIVQSYNRAIKTTVVMRLQGNREGNTKGNGTGFRTG